MDAASLAAGQLHFRVAGDPAELCGAPDTAERPLPDNLHPDATTQRRIGERFA
jgi:hypothetical protein